MLRGLSTTPKPFLKKVLIESATQPEFIQNGFVDLYTDKPKQSNKKTAAGKIKFTFDFNVKMKYPPLLQSGLEQKSIQYIDFQNEVKDLISKSVIAGKIIEDKEQFKTFLALDEIQKEASMQTFFAPPFPPNGFVSWINPTSFAKIHDLLQYTYYDDGVPYINIPVQLDYIYYNQEKSLDNPSFLACIFAIYTNKTVSSHTISSEIIFNNGEISTQTGIFMISDTFRYKNEEQSLYKTEVYDDVEDKDPITGIPIGATKPTNLVQQINKNYGAPGDIWVGQIHWHKYLKEGDPNSGKYRAMAGSAHDVYEPHPFLDYALKPNNKIVDFRSISKMENMFTYKTDIYEKLLASITEVIYTGADKKNTIDELVGQQAIVSEANYSIRPTHEDPNTAVMNSNIHFVFAIDKMKLLKETTKLPGLLDKMIYFNSSLATAFVNQLEFFHFEIIRLNKTTGESMSLITGDNDKLFSDAGSKNSFGIDISKGYVLRNKTDQLVVDNKEHISFYEFTDGDIDASTYDNNVYTYKIRLKFKDPLIKYLRARIQQVESVIRDLDELLHKSELKIQDTASKKFVDVYDRYQNQFNSQFVAESLKPPSNPQLPLGFSFSDNEIPNSIEKAFPLSLVYMTGGQLTFSSDTTSSLTLLLYILEAYDDLEPWKDFYVHMGSFSIASFIHNSLKLSSTTPTLIQQVRSLLALMEDRLRKALSLYATENITKKDVGFTTADYYKSSEVKTKDEHAIEYDYTFKNDIDLSKTKNHFDWISDASSVDIFSGLKTITVKDYKTLVTANKNKLLSTFGKNTVGGPDKFSYGFLPLSVAKIVGADFSGFFPAFTPSNVLSLFNTNDNKLFDAKWFQTIRKALFDRTTNKENSVSIPELLSFFGIRFAGPEAAAFDMLVEKLQEDQQSMEFNFKDNFGEPFAPSDSESAITPDKVKNTKSAFGSVENSDYSWQGMPFDDYPLFLALILLNILTTDNQTKTKTMEYFRDIYSNIDTPFNITLAVNPFANKTMPYEINLFSTDNVASSYKNDIPFDGSYVQSGWLKALFDEKGHLRYRNYALFISLFGLFGKVYYLKSFKQGAKDDNLTPSSYKDRNLIKSMDWVPLRKRTIDNLAVRDQLLCKVELFEGDTYAELLDTKVINLFKHFYNYNQYFFITA